MTQIENLSRTEDQQYVTAIILRSIDILQQLFLFRCLGIQFNLIIKYRYMQPLLCYTEQSNHVPGNFFLKYWYILSPTLSVSRF